ncbi:MAG: DUF3280 domain-containing protein [Hyphomicrobium sp.]
MSFCVSAAVLAVSTAVVGAAEKAAVFPFEIIVEDTLEGIPMANPAEKKRLHLLTSEVVQLLTGAGVYAVADNAPLAAEIDKQSPFFKCNGCEVDIARKLDADFAITGLVQKGSASAANISMAVRSVATGELVRTAGITVLENTDEGWLRGVRRLVKSRLIGEGASK